MNSNIKFFIFALMIATGHSSLAYSINYEATVENSLGKLLLSHDKKHSYQVDLNSFGSAEVYKEFIEIYNKTIKSLPVSYRIQFFWSSMLHLSFDGHYMEEFQKVIAQDCGKEFIAKLKEYVKKEKKLKRYRSRLFLSEKVLEGLKIQLNRRSGQGRP
jgi:hypothetical protein